MTTELLPFSLKRMERAVELVTERLLRATAALERAGVDYAVAGGNAVAAWVTRVDATAVRNTSDVAILLRRDEFSRASEALHDAGFVHRNVGGLHVFLDGPSGRVRDAVHLIFAGEWVRPGEALPNPDVTDSEMAEGFRILTLEALVQIKLTAFRDKDRTHLRDLIEVGLVDASWCNRYPPELAERLQLLINTPDG